MAEVRAVRLLPRNAHASAQLIPDAKAPGEFHFALLDHTRCHPEDVPPNQMARFSFACPRGKGHCGHLIIGRNFKPGAGAPTWEWDGNADAPSLTPSINCRTHTDSGQPAAGCGWHGYLTAGVFRDC